VSCSTLNTLLDGRVAMPANNSGEGQGGTGFRQKKAGDWRRRLL
jgi:hypothetical protein